MEKQKNIPQLRFHEFEGVWERIELGMIGSTYNGLTGKSKDDFGEGKPYIQYKQIFDDSKIDIERFDYVRIDTKEKQNRVLFGDVFFTVSSETPNEIGTASVLLDNVDELYLNSFCFGFRSSHQVLSPWFARYLFRSELFRNEIVKLAQGSTRYNMSKAALMKLIVGLPTLPEQQKIAFFFTTIDQKISQLKRKKTLLEQYKKGVMQKIFSQEIRFKDDNGQEFSKWEKKRLGELTYKTGKKNKGSTPYPIYSINNREGFLPQGDQFEGVDSNSRGYDISLYKIIEEKTFAYNPARINVGSIGFSGDLRDIIISSLYVCFKTKQGLEDAYLLHYLKTFQFNKSVLQNVEGGVRDYLFYENFSNIKINLPSNKEQLKIANFFSAIDDKIHHTQKQIEKAEVWKKGLMQQMFV